jgi:hypothetical protein
MKNTTLAAFARKCKFTHAHPLTQGGGFLLYAVEDCEVCGGDMKAPNSLNVHKVTAKDITEAGLTIQPPPPEGGWSDEHECSACEVCC